MSRAAPGDTLWRMGRVEAIWTKRMKRGPMDPVEKATLVAGEGIEGDANRGRARRQVTVIDRAAWERATAELGVEVDPSARRANVMVSGVELEGSRGRVLRLGPCRVRVEGETTPCHRMDEAHDGLQEALGPEWRGGVHGVVLDDGEIAVGDAAGFDDRVHVRFS